MRAAAIFGLRGTWKQVEPFARAWPGAITQALTVPPDVDAALIFGGDGTVHRHLPALVAHQVPALVVPVGSGNDFAASLGIRSLRHALAAWQRFAQQRDNVRAIDVGVVTAVEGRRVRDVAYTGGTNSGNLKHETGSRFFCCIGGLGLDAETNRRANRLPFWLRRHGGYVLAAAGALANWTPVRICIEDANSSVLLDEPATLVAFANAPQYGDGMRIAPRAQLDDGLLDVCFVRATPRRRIIRHFRSIYSGSHLSMPEVEYFQTKGLRIEAARPLDVYADGEFICQTPIEVTVETKALHVITGQL